MGAEFAHLDRLWNFDPKHPSRIEIAQPDIDRFFRLLNDGKPALIFAAHLANWELPAVCAATHKLDSAVLYRRPNISGIDRWLAETRTASMTGDVLFDRIFPNQPPVITFFEQPSSEVDGPRLPMNGLRIIAVQKDPRDAAYNAPSFGPAPPFAQYNSLSHAQVAAEQDEGCEDAGAGEEP